MKSISKMCLSFISYFLKAYFSTLSLFSLFSLVQGQFTNLLKPFLFTNSIDLALGNLDLVVFIFFVFLLIFNFMPSVSFYFESLISLKKPICSQFT